MLTAREMLFVALGIFAAGYVWIWFTGKGRAPGVPSLLELLIGFVTNFFDTLGIGSFAPTAAIFKFRKMVPDEQIPGTLNVGHTPPTILQAFLFIAIVAVDMTTLVLMISAAVLGAWLGSPNNQVVAAVFYGAIATVGGVLFILMWWYGAYVAKLTSPELGARQRRAHSIAWGPAPLVIAALTAIAFANASLAVAGYVAMVFVYMLPVPRLVALAQRRSRAPSSRRGPVGR